MTRLMTCLKGSLFVGLSTLPVLAQLEGCFNASTTNELRAGVATAMTQVINTGVTYYLNMYINNWLDVPTSFF
ncbi:MAG: hypothetical protein JXQ73_31055 [Phycisphaerae bacterium]|nr:hypothetical protein [Phycisphaerae bacterium]